MMARKSLAEILHGEIRFGRLTVAGEGMMRGKRRTAACWCDCGRAVEVLTFSLTSGSTLSCGCLHKERAAARATRVGLSNRRHGRRGTPEYKAWRAAKERCGNPSSPVYDRYGGRGIEMCSRWRDSFEAFFGDLGAKPSARHTLDRVDNSKGYEPGNCEWREWEPQNRNRRNTVMVDWRGLRVPLAKIAARAKVDYGSLHRRVIKYGWDVERALRTPLRFS